MAAGTSCDSDFLSCVDRLAAALLTALQEARGIHCTPDLWAQVNPGARAQFRSAAAQLLNSQTVEPGPAMSSGEMF